MSSIWRTIPDLQTVNEQFNRDTICEYLDIRLTEIGDDFLKGTMPADKRTFQTYGVVHGGANVVLAETLGSFAGAMLIDTERFQCFGQEVSASHLRPVSEGLVTGTARPIHLGRRSHVWEIHLENDKGKLTCVSKLTLAIVAIE